MTEIDDFAYWRALGRGEKPSMQEMDPRPGFYRYRHNKHEPWQAIAIYRDKNDGNVKAYNRDEKAKCDPLKYWMGCARHWADEAAARFYFAHGCWPSEDPVEEVDARRSNLPSDPFERIKVEISDLVEAAASLQKDIGKREPTQAEAERATNIRNDLGGLIKEADELFAVEKKPVVALAKAIDAKFYFRKAGETACGVLRTLISAFMTAEDKRHQEAARKRYEEERAAAIAKHKEEEEARKSLADSDPGLAALDQDTPNVLTLPEPPAVQKVQVRGVKGRAVGMKTVWGAELVDINEAFTHFREHPLVVELLADLGDKQAKALADGKMIPGYRVYDRKVAA